VIALLCALGLVTLAREAGADVIMTSAGLNDTLKRMERLTRQIEAQPQQADAVFNLAVEADALATLMNQEVEAHGVQERELLDLALSRTKALGIAIQYNKEKKKFFYDGSGFTRYLALSPTGANAAAAEFQLLAYQFYQSTGADAAAVQAAAEGKQRFLKRHPAFKANPELRLYLAIDYRDLYRHYREAHDAAKAASYQRLTRGEYQRIARLYPGSEQADTARQLLRRFDKETRAGPASANR
jgi:hypothetical protein